jgi:hypothetical protein
MVVVLKIARIAIVVAFAVFVFSGGGLLAVGVVCVVSQGTFMLVRRRLMRAG